MFCPPTMRNTHLPQHGLCSSRNIPSSFPSSLGSGPINSTTMRSSRQCLQLASPGTSCFLQDPQTSDEPGAFRPPLSYQAPTHPVDSIPDCRVPSIIHTIKRGGHQLSLLFLVLYISIYHQSLLSSLIIIILSSCYYHEYLFV